MLPVCASHRHVRAGKHGACGTYKPTNPPAGTGLPKCCEYLGIEVKCIRILHVARRPADPSTNRAISVWSPGAPMFTQPNLPVVKNNFPWYRIGYTYVFP